MICIFLKKGKTLITLSRMASFHKPFHFARIEVFNVAGQ